MVFSLFNRKDRVETRRSREAILARTADSRPGPATDTLAAQREAARRTEAKIDQIESEMIASPVVARPGVHFPKPVAERTPTANGVAATPAPRPPANAAPAEGRATSLLGDADGAMAIDVNGPALPGILEEAAILYSNGQAQPAALVLRQALDDTGLAGYQPLAWLMLLDLYQCVGDRAGFETLALEYASRFESSPPGWSEALSQALPGAHDGRSGAAAETADRLLHLGPALDGRVAELVAPLFRAAGREAEIDLAGVVSVDPAGADALLRLFSHFQRGSLDLVVHRAERLFVAARASIEPGRRDRSESCWMLALQTLRILGRQQEFEDLSIEYCVTYEVSPPSWEPIGPRIRLAGTSAGGTGAAAPASPAAGGAASGAFVLRGEVLGRMQNELQALRNLADRRGDVVVDCRGLRRMEFVAAGDLLNEVVTMRSAGRQVLFVEPNYLVYALMLVMGIQDLAEIRRRKV